MPYRDGCSFPDHEPLFLLAMWKSDVAFLVVVAGHHLYVRLLGNCEPELEAVRVRQFMFTVPHDPGFAGIGLHGDGEVTLVLRGHDGSRFVTCQGKEKHRLNSVDAEVPRESVLVDSLLPSHTNTPPRGFPSLDFTVPVR